MMFRYLLPVCKNINGEHNFNLLKRKIRRREIPHWNLSYMYNKLVLLGVGI